MKNLVELMNGRLLDHEWSRFELDERTQTLSFETKNRRFYGTIHKNKRVRDLYSFNVILNEDDYYGCKGICFVDGYHNKKQIINMLNELIIIDGHDYETYKSEFLELLPEELLKGDVTMRLTA